MSVANALQQRVSVRAFEDRLIAPELLTQIFSQAQLSPSNCNVQPWQTLVVSGAKKDQLTQQLLAAVTSVTPPHPDFNWSVGYSGIHRERQFGSANALYNALGIDRKDKTKRTQAMLRNWTFFDAPHVAIFTMDTYLDIMGSVDVGIYAQSLALLMAEQGIGCCMQGALGQFPGPIHELFNLPESRGVLFGMSFGYADNSHDSSNARTERVELENAVSFYS